MTHPGLIHRLTNLRLLDYTITVNVDPLPVRQEIFKEEKEHDRVAGDSASEKKLSLLTVMEKKQRKIAALARGDTLPFHVQFIVRTWDKSKEGLNAKTSAIKNAINSMNSAQYFESALPSTSRKLFYETWPGWLWGGYEHRKLYGESRYVADMLPFNATFTGHLDSAEAIYEGTARNLVGIKTFAGSNSNVSPQHAVLLGMSGAGKSVTVCDLLTQTEGYFAYTVIIEEGLSYGIYTQTVDPSAKPIIIQPDGSITINYLDTKGLPLTPDHLASATALVARMVGVSQHEDKQMLRQAQIAKYINLLYEDVFQDWSRKHTEQLLAIARHAYALTHYRREKMPPGATTLEAFADLRDWRVNHEDEARAFLDGFHRQPDNAQYHAASNAGRTGGAGLIVTKNQPFGQPMTAGLFAVAGFARRFAANPRRLWLCLWRLHSATMSPRQRLSGPHRPESADRRFPTRRAVERLGLCRAGFAPPPRSRRPQSAKTLFRHGLTDSLAIVAACTSRAATSRSATRLAVFHIASAPGIG